MNVLQELSRLNDSLAQKAEPRLAYVGGQGIAGRTAFAWKDRLALVPAKSAEDGETVPFVLGNLELKAKVQAWDAGTGLTVLSWEDGPVFTEPEAALAVKLGDWWVVTARPSLHGPEIRNETVRFVGQGDDPVVQTDGIAFPGFAGAVAWDHEGRWSGFLIENKSGNAGWYLDAGRTKREAERLLATGSRRRVRLGVSVASAVRDGRAGLLITEIEAGSAASKAGWKAGDWLFSLAGVNLVDPRELWQSLSARAQGESLEFEAVLDGRAQTGKIVPDRV